VTIVRTVTQPGTTIEHTVMAPAPAPVTTAAGVLPPAATQVAKATDLNLEGYAKMRTGDYQGTLPLLSQAVQRLSGTGSLDEAYADYNLAPTRATSSASARTYCRCSITLRPSRADARRSTRSAATHRNPVASCAGTGPEGLRPSLG
jgi:hypothetical protein